MWRVKLFAAFNFIRKDARQTEAVLLLSEETKGDQRKLGREDSNWNGNIPGPSANPDQNQRCLQELVREMENIFPQSPPKFLLMDCMEINLSKNRDGRNPQLPYHKVPVPQGCAATRHCTHKEQLLTPQHSPKYHI